MSERIIAPQVKLRLIDLFAGTGAFSHVFSEKGYEVVFCNDVEESSEQIVGLNFQTHPFERKDINKIETNSIPPHDVLCGGFPCQPFSIAGKRQGFEDKRSNVFWKILDILSFHKPSVILLENVKNLKTHDKGRTFKVITENLEKLGYFLKHSILDTAKVTNIPHHRERIYIVGFLDKERCERFEFPSPTEESKRIIDFLDPDVPQKYYYSDRFKIYNTVKNGVTKHVKENTLYQYRRQYVRENKSNQCPTLTANMGTGGHNVPLLLDDKGIRKLTPRECFSFQGFPQTYKLPSITDSRLYKLAGNAVSVPVVELIVSKLGTSE